MAGDIRTLGSRHPVRPTVRAVRAAARIVEPRQASRRPEELRLPDAGHGYDVFGAHPDWVRLAHGLASFWYDSWFRVLSFGHENLPQTGAAILAANHSGALPYDGAMIWMDVLRRTHPARLVRPIADHFVPQIPYVGPFLARTGTVGGSRGNAGYLLESGELLLVFPEGTEGLIKPVWRRYRLVTWRVGHVELAMRHRARVIPVAVVGAEEQMPQVGRLPFRLFGVPHVPVSPLPVPLPVRYRIYYGAPLDYRRADPARADDPAAVALETARVQSAVEALIARGLSERRGWFR